MTNAIRRRQGLARDVVASMQKNPSLRDVAALMQKMESLPEETEFVQIEVDGNWVISKGFCLSETIPNREGSGHSGT